MLLILGLAAAVLALAVVVGQIQGKNPAFCSGAIGWILSAAMTAGAVGLVMAGQAQESGDRRAKEKAEKELVAKLEKEAAGAGDASRQPQPGTPKPGGSTGGGSAKGGKKGGWGRRNRGPIVPLTPEREKRIEDLRRAGATLQARGGEVSRLMFEGKGVKDEHMNLLEGLTGTRSFTIRAPGVSEAALAPLATMTGLTELDLTGTSITDKSMVYLSGMTKLTKLTLTNQAITDKSAIVLAKLTALRTLDLTNTGLTDTGVKRLAGLKSLTRLVLSRTRVGNDGVAALTGITGMKQLELSHTQVNDGVIDHLLKFRNAELFWLTPGPEGVSEKAVGRIRIDLRTCVVRYSAKEGLPKLRAGKGD